MVKRHPIHDRGSGTGGKCSGNVRERAQNFLWFCLGGILASLFLSSTTVWARDPDYQKVVRYDDGIPAEIREIFERVGEEYDICPELMEAIGYRESRFIENVTNGWHYGIMQVDVKVHAERIKNLGYTSKDMFKAEPNIRVAADYLKELYDTYGDDDPIILCLYSGNWKALQRYKEYGWLCPYVSDTLTRAADYERKHGK